MHWSVVWSYDRTRRAIFAEDFWHSVEIAAKDLADPAGFRLAIESMADSILLVFANHWNDLTEVSPSTRSHPVAHIERDSVLAFVLLGRMLPLPPAGGVDSIVVESVNRVERQ